jgi:hypothetical protein
VSFGDGRAGLSVRPVRKFADGKISALEACHVASDLVKRAGLSWVWSSMKSEACYYRHPSRHGLLRIATHSKGGRNPDMRDGPTVVGVTFPESNLKGFTPEYVENHTANAIGLYLIRATVR